MMTADAIALAFNQQNSRKTWKARSDNRPGSETVLFKGTHGMVEITYHVAAAEFSVSFNKVHAAWGDYVRAVARGLYVVLTTLKSAGLPFDAPLSPEGATIRCTVGETRATFVGFTGPMTVQDETMPELKALTAN